MDRERLARTPWRQLTSRPVYENPWIRVRKDQVELPDGRTTLYGVVECAGCVGVLPFLDANTVVLVGQYRYVAGGFYWEMPTGAMRAGESEPAAVQRELAEEAGYEADRLVKLCAYHTSKSVVDETANIYLAEGLRPVARRADPTEFIEVRAFPFEGIGSGDRRTRRFSGPSLAVLAPATERPVVRAAIHNHFFLIPILRRSQILQNRVFSTHASTHSFWPLKNSSISRAP